MDWLRKLAPFRQGFHAWQIEVTSRCALRCPSCFHSRKDTRRRDLPWEHLRRIEPYLDRVDHVILQGWGEPLLYPHLPQALELVASRGASAGFVTSGYGLDRTLASEVIRAGTSFISFSLGGAREATHASLRPGSSLEWIRNGIASLRRAADSRGLGKPDLELTCLLQRRNIGELPEVVELAAQWGAKAVIAINPCHIGDRDQEGQRLFVCGGEPEREHAKLLETAAERARDKGVELRLPALKGGEVLVCEENPLQNLFIASDGEVGPCVNMLPPARRFGHLFRGTEADGARRGFGNLADEDLLRIWNAPAYREFRRVLNERRLVASKELPQREEFPDPPRPCRTCHKMLGL